MSVVKRWLFLGIIALILLKIPEAIPASETETKAPNISLASVPVRQAFVDGDVGKFETHHWMKSNYSGGFEDSETEYQLPNGVKVLLGGQALVAQNDFGGRAYLDKEGLGFVHFDYSQFQKFYDGTGGVYHRFTPLRVSQLNNDLHLNIGRFGMEAGLAIKKWPQIDLLYERDYENGDKSRLTWGAVKEGAITRNIFPSYQEINQHVDTFAIKAEHKFAGINLKGDQRWELFRADTKRVERNVATTGVAADNKMRVQFQEPEADLMTSTIELGRWFLKEKMYASSAYRFSRMRNQEMESIFEMKPDGSLANFANAKQIRDAIAHNQTQDHVWTGNFMWSPWKVLNLIAKLKGELYRNEGNSTYPSDTTPAVPDARIDNVEVSNTTNKRGRLGEGVSLRFTGVPLTALYTEMELEQIGIKLSEDRLSLAGQSPSATGENFNRFTPTNIVRGTWTIGGQFAPWYFVNATAHFRHRLDNNDYDDKSESAPGATTARSAFFDAEKITTNEFKTRATLRLWRWLQPSVRYVFLMKEYASRFESQPVFVDTQMTSHTYVYDLVFQPFPNFMTMASYSQQFASTVTPARLSTSTPVPTFNANVDMWMLSAEYALKPELLLTGAVQYSLTNNFNDFTAIGLPLGTDYDTTEVTVGFRWSINKHVTLEPKYSYYRYHSNPNAEFGDYDAHVIWLEFLMPWG